MSPFHGIGRVAVIGAGAWGTALALQALRAGAATALWARDPDRALAMRAARENAAHLPGQLLPAELRITADAEEALEGADLALLVVPCQHLAGMLPRLPALPPSLVAAKGVEHGTLRLPLEILADARPGLPAGVLSGPNFAREVAQGLPAAAVVASLDEALRQGAAASLSSGGFRLYDHDDPVGAEVGGAAKNVIAIAAGAVIGAGLGENARAALVTRGLAEIARLAVALGGRAETVAGLSGLGDLLLTCTGGSSRNFSLGLALGQGRHLAAILAERNSVTEGVATAPALLARAAAVGVEMPITAAVADVLEGRMDVVGAVEQLMNRPLRQEV
ncbi:NAD(P)H-dependent glycerol-3-phosphate dehydrogenase [Pseudoroseomonas wenyumeiae]|uniref:Glycerol-3-phosphate dehydrogenase [NAD(P)+] n=1 Tax=Teichococcus wenyumeiae TaxID=2478470 RepID=A0A3A9JCY6_9PROT|nr:NAD(P)H-dependent glycerol-3-phosphate dehydrogenase [Pseudoroseomonas wenyumeiae]RKK04020.1 NAD(P)-dependent glycerol-3-phosphate dehydrogenase [Pseudoroseomonas wenyumeiae]RMI20812.1 NAD(P)H-dependent glycerol-3-phosphate dehydrogenase [Pseudoroseomonas wenyumeiae]